jgi:hypothetical protein
VEHFASAELHFRFYEMLALIDRDPEKDGPFIKGHTVGPVTFAAAIRDRKGRIFSPI